eukprot:3435889-Rhodomonas_salina.2
MWHSEQYSLAVFAGRLGGCTFLCQLSACWRVCHSKWGGMRGQCVMNTAASALHGSSVRQTGSDTRPRACASKASMR